MNILDRITSTVRDTLRREKSTSLLDDFKHIAHEHREDRRNFADALIKSPLSPALIAEFKRRSPSGGEFCSGSELSSRVEGYHHADAAALSVLTEHQFFGGSGKDLKAARSMVPIPVLRKDFIIDEYQIWEAASWPADAILLIARCLSRSQLDDYLGLLSELGMDALVEIFDPRELEWVLDTPVKILGINNRNLDTLEINLDRSVNLKRDIPYDYLTVSESGIHTPEDIQKIRGAGFHAVLIGEHFMKSPADTLKENIQNLF